MNRHTAWISLAIISLGLLLLGAGTVGRDVQTQERGAIGYRMHAFSLPVYDGGTFTQKDLAGRVTLLIFWYPT